MLSIWTTLSRERSTCNAIQGSKLMAVPHQFPEQTGSGTKAEFFFFSLRANNTNSITHPQRTTSWEETWVSIPFHFHKFLRQDQNMTAIHITKYDLTRKRSIVARNHSVPLQDFRYKFMILLHDIVQQEMEKRVCRKKVASKVSHPMII